MNASILKDLRRSWPGLLVSLVLLVFVFSIVDLQELLDALLLADFRYFIPAFFVFFLGLATRSFAWRVLLQESATFKQTFYALNEGYLLNNVLPFRLGEFGRAFLLGRSADLGFLRVLSTIVVERVFDLTLVLSALVLSLPFVAGAGDWARPTVLTMAPILLAAFFTLYLLARNRERIKAWLVGLQDRITFLQRIPLDQMDTFFKGLEALTQMRRFLLVFGSLALTWLLVIYHYYLVLLAFVPEGEFLWAAFGIGVVGLGVAIPSAPGSLGVVQAVIVYAFPRFFGVDPAEALAYGIIVHGFYLVITSGLGLMALSRDGESLAGVYAEVRARVRKKEKEAGD